MTSFRIFPGIAGWLAFALVAALKVSAAESTAPGNRPERVEWFRDLGFGLFIHWSVDSQLGIVISHSLVGASADFTERFFQLGKTFDPQDFQPRRWAKLAKLAGLNYMVFTTKHHSGFCMFETATTDFAIKHTPYARDLTRPLIETRAKGGNLLLNIGPTPDGAIPFEQERLLREVAAWMFINREAIQGTRPWHMPDEKQVNRDAGVWFTQARDGSAVYACITGVPWAWGTRREFVFASLQATDRTQVSVLGESGRELEYRPDVNPRPAWRNTPQGLHVSAMRTKRVYNDYDWPNAVVLKLTHVKPSEKRP